MAKTPTTEMIAAELTVPERVLLLCLHEQEVSRSVELSDDVLKLPGGPLGKWQQNRIARFCHQLECQYRLGIRAPGGHNDGSPPVPIGWRPG
jgi:hypothetical protein